MRQREEAKRVPGANGTSGAADSTNCKPCALFKPAPLTIPGIIQSTCVLPTFHRLADLSEDRPDDVLPVVRRSRIRPHYPRLHSLHDRRRCSA